MKWSIQTGRGTPGGAIAARYGNSGFVGQINLNFIGSVGQSFGAFNLAGMSLKLEGEANDYVGMHVVKSLLSPRVTSYAPEQNVIVGNTCLTARLAAVFANGWLVSARCPQPKGTCRD